MKKENGYYIDKNNNRWDCVLFTEDQARCEARNGRYNHDCIDCIDCKKSSNLINCRECSDCTNCTDCEHLIKCDECVGIEWGINLKNKKRDVKEILFQESIAAAKKEKAAAEKNWKKIEDDYDPQIGRKTGLYFGGNAEDFDE